ncbi:hypothetical protein [Nannocystis radixulma]|uniref:WD40-like Beta Propeller Repeat n=1 Tax=Nannocystis radixulma TaxID=2995305 RepID=A0ABT5B0N5_9BACT|nr:hypothetical protein [Nannocystis radixulma]MDC0667308.1 hypothetical protein [Nannocystis radixulma]
MSASPPGRARWFALGCLLWLALLADVARAGTRDQRWRTLETEHFVIHYYQGSEIAAERAAATLERAHSRLAPDLGHSPFLRTQVVMTDDTDSANGSATVVPYAHINGNVTAPESMSVLESYDDYIDVLLTHEYTHIVHIDTIHGIPRLVNAILGFGVLGKVWPPNGAQPRWFIEGLATYEESRLSSQGRHRSAQFDTMLRMHVLEHGFQPIDRVSSPGTIFPNVTTVYLYGLHLVDYIGTHYGHDKLRELSHTYGGQAVPYGIHRACEKVLGITFEQLWKEFELDTTRRFQAQARAIRGRGIREGRRLTYTVSAEASNAFTRRPFWSDDDSKIYFYDDDGHSNPGIRRISSRGGRIREGVGVGRQGQSTDIERVVEVQGSTSGSFLPGGKDIVFEQYSLHDLRYAWNDLYLWHGEHGAPNARQGPADVEQLTFGLRARDAMVAPDGRSVVFVRNDAAQSRLAFLDLHTREVTEIAPVERTQQVYTPRWSPDGKKVAYSMHRAGGYRDLYVYDREAGTHTRMTADRWIDTTPAYSPDGRWLLFSSDRDHVINVYAIDLATGRTRQVTNVLGAAFDAVVSHDGTRIAYIGASSTGYDLWVMKFDPANFLEPLPVVDDLPVADEPNPPLPGDRGRPSTARSKRYRPIRTMYPRAIAPASLDFGGAGQGLELGVKLELADVVGYHRLTGTFRQFVAYNQPTGSVEYVFARFVPTFRLGFRRDFRVHDSAQRYSYDNISSDGSFQPYLQSGYRERQTAVRVGVDVPIIRHAIHNASASLDYVFTRFRDLDRDRERLDPNAPASTPPAAGDLGRVDLELRYSNLRAVRYGYAEETGRAASVRLSVVDPHFGGEYGDIQVGAAYTERIRMPWRGHQVLAFRLGGGASAGGLGRLGGFRLGGLRDQPDVIQSFLRREAFGEAGYLRGFAWRSLPGDYYAVLNTEYRTPLVDVERGMSALPLYLRRLTMIPFADVGVAWTERLNREALRWSLGMSLVFSFRIGYRETIDLFFTYAHGFAQRGDVNYFRALIARSF